MSGAPAVDERRDDRRGRGRRLRSQGRGYGQDHQGAARHARAARQWPTTAATSSSRASRTASCSCTCAAPARAARARRRRCATASRTCSGISARTCRKCGPSERPSLVSARHYGPRSATSGVFVIDAMRSLDGAMHDHAIGRRGAASSCSWRRARTGPGCRARCPTACCKELVDLMKMGPTASNSLPARIVFVKSKAAKERLKPHLSEGNATRPWRRRPAPSSATTSNSTSIRPKGQDPLSGVRGQAGARADDGVAQQLAAGRLLHPRGARARPRLRAHVGLRQCRRRQGVFRRHRRQIEFSVQSGIRRSGGLRPRGPRFAFEEMAKIS